MEEETAAAAEFEGFSPCSRSIAELISAGIGERWRRIFFFFCCFWRGFFFSSGCVCIFCFSVGIRPGFVDEKRMKKA